MIAYREFPVDIVLSACHEYLKRRNERIEREREDLINKEMTPGWFFPKSREQAIENLKSSGDILFSEWDMIEWSGRKWKCKVDDLIGLCEAVGGGSTVSVSSEMASVIF